MVEGIGGSHESQRVRNSQAQETTGRRSAEIADISANFGQMSFAKALEEAGIVLIDKEAFPVAPSPDSQTPETGDKAEADSAAQEADDPILLQQSKLADWLISEEGLKSEGFAVLSQLLIEAYSNDQRESSGLEQFALTGMEPASALKK